ncbi:Pectic enzymes secretion protein outO [Serratia quinivorans]|uniref:prepilin peptidase n=1 Tax=Serratia quinivorans TaxID=137545 RepID=UPI00217BB2BF|nr:A24 family peptidase [Serratia quinivorans]CAI1926031.1 Pectic enzymes secretion protein outO [Serratia quinivorans]
MNNPLSLTLGGWVLLSLVSLCVGSFLNVVIHRLPLMIRSSTSQRFNLCWPCSHCPQCKTPLRWYDNLPLISWLALHGHCRDCHHVIALRYPMVELAAVGIALLCAALFPLGYGLCFALIFGWTLLALSLIDIDHQLLPDNLTLPLLWCGLLFQLITQPTQLGHAVIGAISGYLCLWLLYWGFRLATGREALGYGDFKLLAALGAWLGWHTLPSLLLIASACGIAATIFMRMFWRRPVNTPMPFGPFLALAGWGVFLYSA